MMVPLLGSSALALLPALLAVPAPPRAALIRCSVADDATARVLQLRVSIEDAEEQLRAEVEHSKKFMCRGEGLREDFARSRYRRRRALLLGAAENERALLEAMNHAQYQGLPAQYLEEALTVANNLALSRAELQQDWDQYLNEAVAWRQEA